MHKIGICTLVYLIRNIHLTPSV